MKSIVACAGGLLLAGQVSAQGIVLDAIPEPVFIDAEAYLKTVARTACTAALPEDVSVVEGDPDIWAYDPRTLVGAIRVAVVQEGETLELWCHIDMETEDFFLYSGTVTPWEELDRPQAVDPDAFTSLFLYDQENLGQMARAWCAAALLESDFATVITSGTRVSFIDPARVTVSYLKGDSEETLEDAFLCHVAPAIGGALFTPAGESFPDGGWPMPIDLATEMGPVYVNEAEETSE